MELPVSLSRDSLAPGDSVDVTVFVSDEVAARASAVEAALYCVVKAVEEQPFIAVAARAGVPLAPGSHALRLTLPAGAPASLRKRNRVSWLAGAVAVVPRAPDLRSFHQVQVWAVPDPAAPAATRPPQRLGPEKTGPNGETCELTIDLVSRDVPVGAPVTGVLRLVPRRPDWRAVELEHVTIRLIQDRTGTGEYGIEVNSKSVGETELLRRASLAPGVRVDLPFKFDLPADADSTSELAAFTPAGRIPRKLRRAGAAPVYEPERVVADPGSEAFANRWRVEAWLGQSGMFGWRVGASLEVRVHNAPAGTGAGAGAAAAVASTPPPGWYADPHGAGLRWWDGAQWTGHTAPGGA